MIWPGLLIWAKVPSATPLLRAGRRWPQDGIFHQPLKIAAGGKPLARFPHAHGGNGKTQIPGNYLERKFVLPPPIAKGFGKAGADVTVKLRL